MPVHELGVDAAVLFADIMLPIEPMGVGVRIEPEVGPIIDRPIRSAADVEALRPFDAAGVAFTMEAIRLVRRELDGAAGLIGFSGAPFTLACYLIEGRPGVGPAEYREFVQPHVRTIFDALRDVPTIHFGTGTGSLLELLAQAGGDVIGLDHRVSLGDAWRRVGHDRGVQGNLDAARLLAGWDATRSGAQAVLDEAAGRPGHIFNLGHGVLPETDTDLLRRLVDFVHEETANRPAPSGVMA